MTQVVPTERVTIDNTKVSRVIEYKSAQKDGISFATILQAAWSVVLSGLTGKNDAFFEYLI
ncbi:hypothetical protein HD806DRAFT_510517 [Xylariaceae sp. AK1471]|nr:hypothetical protein HD806DRAFT_510517 [Xylariaceae sp. AK1471]